MASYLPPESVRVGTGVETVFGFDFPYLRGNDIAVTLNDVPVTWTLVGTAQVYITPAPTYGTTIRIYRNTPAQAPKYLFATGIPMLPKYIDENNRQLLYALQEGLYEFDAALSTSKQAILLAQNAVVVANTAANSVEQNVSRSIRVPLTDASIPTLPSVGDRAGKILGFDAVGNPIATLPGTGSAAELAIDLADPLNPTKGVGMLGFDGTSLFAHLRDSTAKIFDTYADLLLQDTTTCRKAVTLGYSSPNDGGAAMYYVYGGQWQIIKGQHVTPAMFGAVGDGVADDTAAWQAAINSGAPVHGLDKSYVVTKVELPTKAHASDAKLLSKGGGAEAEGMCVLQITGTVQPKRDIALRRIDIDGRRQLHTNISFGDGGDGNRCGIAVVGVVDNLLLEDVTTDNCATDGLALFGASAGVTFALSNIRLVRHRSRWNRRHGTSLDSCKGFYSEEHDWGYNGRDLPDVDPEVHAITSGYFGARVGSVDGPQYGNGIDIESYGADATYSTHVEDAVFVGGTALQNLSGGVKILPMPHGSDLPTWQPMKNFTFIGGHWDHGVAPASAETSPLQVGATLGLPAALVGMRDLYVYGARCSSSIAINNTVGGRICATVDAVNGGTFKYHAFIQDSILDLDLVTPEPLAVYQDGSLLTGNVPMAKRPAPALASTATCTVASQATTLLSSSKDNGRVYRITASITNIQGNPNLPASLTFSSVAGVVDARGATQNTGNGVPYPTLYVGAGVFTVFTGGAYATTLDLLVTVR